MFTSKVGQPDDLLIIYRKEDGETRPERQDKKKEPEFKYRALESLLLMHSHNLLKHRAQKTKIQFLY